MGHSQVKHEMFNYAKRFEILSGYVQVAKQNTAQRIPHHGLRVKHGICTSGRFKPFELVVTAPENHFEKCSNDPLERARSNCSGA